MALGQTPNARAARILGVVQGWQQPCLKESAFYANDARWQPCRFAPVNMGGPRFLGRPFLFGQSRTGILPVPHCSARAQLLTETGKMPVLLCLEL